MGLIARSLEAAGIPTVSISLARELTQAVGTPRAVFLKWPLGHPLGEPEHPAQQRTVIFVALQTLLTAAIPGLVLEPGFRWRREQYAEPEWSQLIAPRHSDLDS